MAQWMIYAANGFLGQQLVKEAVRLGHQPIIAARDEASIMPLADALALEYRVFDVKHEKVLKDQLQSMTLVVNCAELSLAETDRFYRAALFSGCHYVGVNADQACYTQAFSYANEAVDKGIVLLPTLDFYTVSADIYMQQYSHQKTDLGSLAAVNIIYQQALLSSPARIKSLLHQWRSKPLKRLSSPEALHLTVPIQAAHEALKLLYHVNVEQQLMVHADDKNMIKRLSYGRWLLALPWCFNWAYQALLKVYHQQPLKPFSVTVQLQLLDEQQQCWLDVKEHIEDRDDFTLSCLMQSIDALLAHKILPGVLHPSQALDHERTFSLNKNNAESDDDFLPIDSEQWE